jgi:hypothetical protein
MPRTKPGERTVRIVSYGEGDESYRFQARQEFAKAESAAKATEDISHERFSVRIADKPGPPGGEIRVRFSNQPGH